jgi:prepilin-type N-terminal cleavage/methylation domain-containing protein
MKMKPEMKYILNNKGFTLVELMVIVVLIGIVLSIVYNMMTTGNRIFAQGDAKADVQSSLRVMKKMEG